MERYAFGSFLRSRRERVLPTDVGLPAGRRRRTPGLRREEVAQLAYISTEYYTRLEQARGPRPSREVLEGLVVALRLSGAERDHLYLLAGISPALPPGPPREVRASIRTLLRRLPLAAATVNSAIFEVLAWNDLAAALMEDFSAVPPRDRNLARLAFLGPESDGLRLYGLSDLDEFRRSVAVGLRGAMAKYPNADEVGSLVAELRSGSAEFDQLWTAAEIEATGTLRKTFHHRLVGPVTVNCDVLDVAGLDQQVVIYTADPGSSSEEALRLLSVIGTQRLDVGS
ncbi:MAG: helix-turn-helix domain-containing protein [Microlunatus sp.]|nr:helix-turn-helix domain-containing protein [Microlunatus sp.]